MSVPSKVCTKVDLDAVRRLCAPGSGVHGAEHLVNCLAHSAKAELLARAILDRLLDIEIIVREDRADMELTRRPGHSAQHETPAYRRPATERKDHVQPSTSVG